MAKAKRYVRKRLSRKQIRLINSLCASKSEERTVLTKHKVSRHLFRKWLSDAKFCEELNQAVAGGYRRSKFMLARSAHSAAEKLVVLAKTGKGETARKACMDIITMKPQRSSPPHPLRATTNPKNHPQSPLNKPAAFSPY